MVRIFVLNYKWVKSFPNIRTQMIGNNLEKAFSYSTYRETYKFVPEKIDQFIVTIFFFEGAAGPPPTTHTHHTSTISKEQGSTLTPFTSILFFNQSSRRGAQAAPSHLSPINHQYSTARCRSKRKKVLKYWVKNKFWEAENFDLH